MSRGADLVRAVCAESAARSGGGRWDPIRGWHDVPPVIGLTRRGGVGRGWWPMYGVTVDGCRVGMVAAYGSYPRADGDRPSGWRAVRAHGPRVGMIHADGFGSRAEAVAALVAGADVGALRACH